MNWGGITSIYWPTLSIISAWVLAFRLRSLIKKIWLTVIMMQIFNPNFFNISQKLPIEFDLMTSNGMVVKGLPGNCLTYEGVDEGQPFILSRLELSELYVLTLDTRWPEQSRLISTVAFVSKAIDQLLVFENGFDFHRSLTSYRVKSHASRWIREQHADELMKLTSLLNAVDQHYKSKGQSDVTVIDWTRFPAGNR